MRRVIFGKDFWDCYWGHRGQEKNMSSSVMLPQLIARHISAPVTFSFLKNKC